MGIQMNHNQKAINRLAKNSIRSGKMRNFFIIVTIALSVSLLMAMALVQTGHRIEMQRIVDRMQHVIYMETSEEAIQKLSESDQVSYLALMKQGQGMEAGGKIIQPVYRQFEPMVGAAADVEGIRFLEGKEPEAMNEVAVPKAYLQLEGIEPKVGTSFDMTFLDGTTEHVTVSGITEIEETAKTYPVFFSEEYAQSGAQLQAYPYQAVVRIKDASDMDQNTFLKEIRDMAKACGIERKFVNENNHFLVTLLGGEYEIRDTLLIIGLGVGILFVSVLVIYSVFYLSVVGRIRQFGQLRTVGMTKKQIKKLIFREGLLLSAVGIPIGASLGCIIGYLIKPKGWDLKNVLGIFLVVAIADILTVLISIYKPAKTASSIAPVEAAKFSGYQSSQLPKETKQLRRKLTPVNLACMSAKRNRKKATLTVISLGVGGILFMLATTFIVSTSLEEYARQAEFQYGEFDLRFSGNEIATNPHGKSGIQLNNPLNEELKAEILAIDGVKEIREFQQTEIQWEANGEMIKDGAVPITKNDVEQYVLEGGNQDYNDLVEQDGVLICANETVKEIMGWEFKQGDEIRIRADNGREEVSQTFKVAGFLDAAYREVNVTAGWIVLPEDSLLDLLGQINLNVEFIVKTEEEKRGQIEAELEQIIENQPLLYMSTLEQMKVETEKQFSIIFSVILGLSIFIIGFSFINMTNTIITNILTRKQEFAMLQSIGMSAAQLKHMVNAEGVLLAIGNIAITLTVGTLAAYGEVLLLQYVGAEYMHFTFPVWFVLGYVVFIIGTPPLISQIIIRNFQKQSLVERLRETEG